MQKSEEMEDALDGTQPGKVLKRSRVTIPARNPTPRDIKLVRECHSHVLHNWKKKSRMTQVSTDWRMDKESGVEPYDGILLGQKKG